MKLYRLEDMTKGWFVGNFQPTIIPTNDVEVAVKSYKAGDYESRHFHRVATEITVITHGEVRMNGVTYGPGSIIVISPNEATDFEALTDVTTTVVKYPGASNDKYMGTPE